MRFNRFIAAIENTSLTLPAFIASFTALIIARLTVENALGLFKTHPFSFLFFEFSHTFLFFLCAFLLILPLVRFAGATTIGKAANILLCGFLIILTPPIIDTIIFHGTNFWSFYEFDGFRGLIIRFFTLFGDTPEIGITYGVRVETVLVTLLMGLYAYAKSDWKKALLSALGTYSILFILGTFPSWITLAVLSFQKGFFAINATDVAALFLSPERIFSHDITDFRSVLNVKMSIVYAILSMALIGATLWKNTPKYFIALWKNARFPQLVWHGGLLAIGMALAFFFSDTFIRLDLFHFAGAFVILAAVESAWLASVIMNDLYDIRIDQKTNPDRPLIRQAIPPETYRAFGIFFFAASLLFAGIMSFQALLLILCYQSLAWIYSAEPLRLKRFPIIATLIAAAAGMLVFCSGYLIIAPDQNLHSLPLPISLFLLAAYTLCLPIKDFKDVEGDRADGVYTLPVILGTQNAALILGSLMFILFVSSPFILRDDRLFLPAIFSGSLAFWAMQRGTDTNASFVSFRKLPGVILGITILYGFMILAILF